MGFEVEGAGRRRTECSMRIRSGSASPAPAPRHMWSALASHPESCGPPRRWTGDGVRPPGSPGSRSRALLVSLATQAAPDSEKVFDHRLQSRQVLLVEPEVALARHLPQL